MTRGGVFLRRGIHFRTENSGGGIKFETKFRGRVSKFRPNLKMGYLNVSQISGARRQLYLGKNPYFNSLVPNGAPVSVEGSPRIESYFLFNRPSEQSKTIYIPIISHLYPQYLPLYSLWYHKVDRRDIVVSCKSVLLDSPGS